MHGVVRSVREVVMFCSFCDADLPAEAFPPAETASGRASKCLSCSSGDASPQRSSARSEQLPPRRKQPQNPFIVARRRQFKASKADRIRAWKAVARALKAGVLTRQPCEARLPGCISEPAEAHHRSYEPGRELDVRWLCKPCHDSLTAQATAAANRDRAHGRR